jgi:hypothetical protein
MAEKEKFTAVIDVDTARAIQALTAYRQSFENANRETKKGETGADDAGKKIGGLSGVVQGATKDLAAYALGFGSVGVAVRSITGLVNEMAQATQKSVQRGREFLDLAVSMEQTAMKLAQLRGDISQIGIGGSRRDILNLARETGTTPQQAERAIFFGESAFGRGTQAGLAAGKTVSMMAGPAGLSPQEVKQIPKLFSILGATTEQSQLRALNMLNRAAGGSIAELGEFTDPFISAVVSMIERGIPYDEALAYMQTGIQTSGSPAEAATNIQRLTDISAGRTEGGLEFLSTKAAEQGVDFGALSDRERLAFTRDLFLRTKAAGPAAMDELKTKLDVRGFATLRAMYSDAGLRQFDKAMGEIPQAGMSGEVESMYRQYQGSLTAEQNRMQVQAIEAQIKTIDGNRGRAMLGKTTDDLFKLYEESRTAGEVFAHAGPASDSRSRRRLRREFLRTQLDAAREMADTPEEQANIDRLLGNLGSTIFDLDDREMIGEIYEATHRFRAMDIAGEPVDMTGRGMQTERIFGVPVPGWGQKGERNVVNQHYYGYTVVPSRGSSTPQSANELPD